MVGFTVVVLNTVLSAQLCLAFPGKLMGCQAGPSVETKTHTRLGLHWPLCTWELLQTSCGTTVIQYSATVSACWAVLLQVRFTYKQWGRTVSAYTVGSIAEIFLRDSFADQLPCCKLSHDEMKF